MKDLMIVIGSILVTIFFLYGAYYVAKNISYSLFYEDMVIETIKELVKKEGLK